MRTSNLPPDATELYLRGELDAATRSQYEVQLQADPVLQSELELHQELQHGLGIAKRRLELKQMLQNTPVSGAGNPILHNPALQWLSAGIASIVVVGTLWMVNQPVENVATPEITKSVVKAAPVTEAVTTEPSEQPLTDVVTEPAPIVNSETNKEVAKAAPQKNTSQPNKGANGSKTSDNEPKFDEQGQENPINLKSEVISGAGDNSNQPSMLPKSDIGGTSAVSETILKSDANYNFHYQFMEGKLYLYGKFDKGLYEVIDLGGKDGKRSFLYYQNTYYQVLPGTSKVTQLSATDDKGIVASLDKLRKK